MMIATTDHLMTIKEVQKITRLGKTKVNNLIQGGQLPSLKIGKSRRVRRSDLDAFLERLATDPT